MLINLSVLYIYNTIIRGSILGHKKQSSLNCSVILKLDLLSYLFLVLFILVFFVIYVLIPSDDFIKVFFKRRVGRHIRFGLVEAGRFLDKD